MRASSLASPALLFASALFAALPFATATADDFAADFIPSRGCVPHRHCRPSSGSLPGGLRAGGPTQNLTITSHGIDRNFLIHLPKSYKPWRATPMYFSFHGANRNASEQEDLSQFSNPFFNPHGIAVYPNAIDEHWLSNPAVSITPPNDIDFVLDLIEYLEDNFCIDTRRIFASGKSNGGGLTNLLACNATSAAKFGAFASVSGAYYLDSLATTDCHPGRSTIPFLEFHGLNDTTVPYAGKNCTGSKCQGLASNEPSIPTFLDGWVERNGCKGKEDTPRVEKGLFPGGLVDKLSWSCGPGKKDVVVHYREDDLGHIWPSTVPNDDCEAIPAQCPAGHYTFNATSVIFDFFKKWPLPPVLI